MANAATPTTPPIIQRPVPMPPAFWGGRVALRAPLQSSYYLVCAESDVAREGVAAFREWLLAEAAKELETA